ncbi:MAG: hypothetical protein KDB03_08605 [Planctomycetales bacterium]|nr:hypothetical protein [Planctomycetales bacterium]
MKQILESINEVLQDGGRKPLPSICRSDRLREDLELDSLELAVLTVKLEAITGIDVFAKGIAKTIGDVEDRLVEK